MAEWLTKDKFSISKSEKDLDIEKKSVSWEKCPECGDVIYKRDLMDNMGVCSNCSYHFRLTIKQRINMMIDKKTFREFGRNISSADPLTFTDAKEPYTNKIKRSVKKSITNEAVITGSCLIGDNKVILAVMDFSFLGGSMGSAVGDKIYKASLRALKKHVPFIIVSTSGGARMHEGILSLMQMAKTSAGLTLLSEKSIPYISIITNPTTGGVTASFAMLGDIIIAEPKAIVGFAGRRVIEQNIKEDIPEDFQSAEFLQENGFVDMIIDRRNLKQKLIKILDFFNS